MIEARPSRSPVAEVCSRSSFTGQSARLRCAVIGFFCGWASACCASCSSSAAPGSDRVATNAGNAGSAGAAATGPSGTVECASEPGVDTYAPGLTRSGANGTYNFELVSSAPSPPALNDNTFVLRVTDATGAPLDGELSAALDMPEHGHSSPKTPVISFDAVSGNFTLEPMDLFMVGLWRFTFTFTLEASTESGSAGANDSANTSDGAGASDTAVFELCVD